MGLMLAASSFTGCQTEIEPADRDGEVRPIELTIDGRIAPATRTTMEGDKTTGFHTEWRQSDRLGVYTWHPDVVNQGAFTKNASFNITSLEDGTATFRGEIMYDGYYRTWDLFAYYPMNTNLGYDDTRATNYKAVPNTLSRNQIMPSNGTHDPRYDYMVALPGQTFTIDANNKNQPFASIGEFAFRYVVGFLNLSIKDIVATGVSASEIVSNVKVSAASGGGTPRLAGSFNLDLTDGAMNFTSSTNEVTVALPANTTLGDLDAWFVVNPFTADKLTFTITTDKNVITKSVNISEFDVKAGDVKTFNMMIDDDCTIGEAEPIPLVRAQFQAKQNSATPNTHSYALRFYDYSPTGADRNGFQLDVIVIAGPFEYDKDRETDELPNATYNFTTDQTMNSVYNHQYLTYVMTVEDGRLMKQITIREGSMKVEGDSSDYKITFDIVRSDGVKMVAVYEGPLSLPNPDYIPSLIELGTQV